jgi:hypothetical protein
VESEAGFPKQVTDWHWFPVYPELQEQVSTAVQEPFPEQTVESVEALPKQVTVWHWFPV